MDEIHDRYVLEFKLRNVVLFMAIVTLTIAVLGIYSAITLDTERRQKYRLPIATCNYQDAGQKISAPRRHGMAVLHRALRQCGADCLPHHLQTYPKHSQSEPCRND